MAEVNFSNTDNRNETRPQLSSYVKGAVGALNEHEYQKMSRMLEEEYSKQPETILDKSVGEVLNNTVNFFGNSYDIYYEKLLDARVSRKLFNVDETSYLNDLQTHLIALSLFIRDSDNIIYLGILLIILSFILCFINIIRGNEFRKPTESITK